MDESCRARKVPMTHTHTHIMCAGRVTYECGYIWMSHGHV